MGSERNRNPVGQLGQTVARNVRRLRGTRDLSTREMAAQLAGHGRPIPATGITRIEHGFRAVDVDDLAAIAAVLGVEIGELLSLEPCAVCKNQPPDGFICRTCGAGADQPATDVSSVTGDDHELIPWWPDAAERLGGISRTTMYNLIRSGELPSVTIRRRRFIRASDLDRLTEGSH